MLHTWFTYHINKTKKAIKRNNNYQNIGQVLNVISYIFYLIVTIFFLLLSNYVLSFVRKELGCGNNLTIYNLIIIKKLNIFFCLRQYFLFLVYISSFFKLFSQVRVFIILVSIKYFFIFSLISLYFFSFGLFKRKFIGIIKKNFIILKGSKF